MYKDDMLVGYTNPDYKFAGQWRSEDDRLQYWFAHRPEAETTEEICKEILHERLGEFGVLSVIDMSDVLRTEDDDQPLQLAFVNGVYCPPSAEECLEEIKSLPAVQTLVPLLLEIDESHAQRTYISFHLFCFGEVIESIYQPSMMPREAALTES